MIDLYTDMQFYSASFLGDIREVVSHVNRLYPDANMYAVGWSLGANILVQYLGQVRCLLISFRRVQFLLIMLLGLRI